METRQLVQSIGLDMISSVCGLPSNKIDVINISVNSSPLILEIQTLFSFNEDKGLFVSENELREFKYDFSNNCGVLTKVSEKNYVGSKIIQIYGDQGILEEKGWL
ncbi:hypothetical protein AAGG74_19085 [Bacillus mexicanus]|uniref:hypothetical protein n=1 Tax=Bacillus mexicanus TaxID=2834415 RepID=UPI003D1FCBB0